MEVTGEPGATGLQPSRAAPTELETAGRGLRHKQRAPTGACSDRCKEQRLCSPRCPPRSRSGAAGRAVAAGRGAPEGAPFGGPRGCAWSRLCRSLCIHRRGFSHERLGWTNVPLAVLAVLALFLLSGIFSGASSRPGRPEAGPRPVRPAWSLRRSPEPRRACGKTPFQGTLKGTMLWMDPFFGPKTNHAMVEPLFPFPFSGNLCN